MTPEHDILKQTNDAYAELRRDPARWQAELEERAEWETTIGDGLDDDSTEHVHTLTACTRCDNGYRPRDMVPAGDGWLCVRCAGKEIFELRNARDCAREEIAWLRRPETVAEFAKEHALDALAALGKEQP